MVRGRGRLALLGTLLGVVVLLAGCSSKGSSASSGGTSAAATTTPASTAAAAGGSGSEITLTAHNISWSTTSLKLTAGAKVKVEVVNKDKVEHNFTFTQAKAAKDVEGGEDASLGFTAPAAGTYKFFCKYHPTKMVGTITVT